MSRLTLITIHGWALTPEFWAPLERALSERLARHAPCFRHVDCGSFKSGARAEAGGPGAWGMEPGRTVILTHSLGTLWLQRYRDRFPPDCAALICCAGFPRFVAAPQFPAGVPARVLDRMIARFQQQPLVVATDFLERAAGSGPGRGPAFQRLLADLSRLDPAALAGGLHELRDLDFTREYRARAMPLLSLVGRDDAIAGAAMSQALLPADRAEVAAGSRQVDTGLAGHLFPYFFAPDCAVWIADFLEGLL